MHTHQVAWSHLEALCRLGPRLLGTSEHAAADAMLWRHLGQADWRRRQRFPIAHPQKKVFGHNLWGRFLGSSPGRLMLAVRYDAGYCEADAQTPKVPRPAANEGASGAACLTSLAGLLAERRDRPTVDIVFFDGGGASDTSASPSYCGVEAFLANLPAFERPDCVIVLGAVAGSELMLDVDLALTEHVASRDFSWALFRLASLLGLSAFGMQKDPPCRDLPGEHRALVAADIATCMLTDGDYKELGTADDTLAACDAASLGQVVALLEAAIFRLAVAA